jgi:hypothetical protein
MAEEQQQETLRDTLANAFEEVEQPPAATAVADSRSDRPRAEDGKFAKAPETQETQPEEKVERPSTWKKDYWEKYDKLDPDLRKYILQRENEYKAGLSTYNGEVKSAQTLKQAIEPFMPELQRHNIDPAQWIRNLGNAHQTLALGSPQAKAQMFMKLAQDYGVDLRQLGSPQQVDPQLQYITQNLQGLQQQWEQFQTQQQLAEQQAISQTIEEFKADAEQHPHFDAVRETMAGLLQSGMAQNLQEAYDKAVYMSPEVREQVLAAQQQREQASRLEQQASLARQARAKAVSPRSVTPGAPKDTGAKKGLRDSLAEAFGSVESGRV